MSCGKHVFALCILFVYFVLLINKIHSFIRAIIYKPESSI